MLANMFGPMEGRRHDCALLAASDLLTKLSQHSFAQNGQALSIYGSSEGSNSEFYNLDSSDAIDRSTAAIDRSTTATIKPLNYIL